MVIVGQQCGVASRNGEDAEMAATKGATGAGVCAVGCAGAAAERAGEQVVCFENCAGIKPARCCVDAGAKDILSAIADAYLTIGCAVMTPNRRRFDMIPALIEEFHADAVLDIALSSCHTYLIEGRSLRELCHSLGVPYMALETDYSQLDAGQIDTRIAAFVESL